jgi:hypothetical protein
MIDEFNFTFLMQGTTDETGVPDEPPWLLTISSSHWWFVSANGGILVFRSYGEGKDNHVEYVVDLNEGCVRRRPADTDIPGEYFGKFFKSPWSGIFEKQLAEKHG